MNGLDKIINIIKNDNKIKYSILFFIILISYWVLAPWLGINQGTKERAGTIQMKNENYDKNKNYDLKVTDNKEQRDSLLNNEVSVRNKKMKDDDATYIRKKYLREDEKVNENNYNFIKRSIIKDDVFKYDEYVKNCRLKKIKCLNNNNENCEKTYEKCKSCIDDFKICKKNKNEDCKEIFTECNKNLENDFSLLKKKKLKIKKKLKVKKKPDFDKIKIRDDKLIKNSDDNAKIYFGEKTKKRLPKNYNKYIMILSDVHDYQFGGASLSSTKSETNDYTDINNINSKSNSTINTQKEIKDTFKIFPGSSYIADLITPLNSLYKEDIKPILDFKNGDLEGYRGVGEVKYKENSAGLIILITELWDKQGNVHKVKGYGIQYTGEEMTPTFEDEIDRHLLGRIGYSVLAGIVGAYGQTAELNNDKLTLSATVDNAATSSVGSVLGQTFADLASAYKTEVKVHPQKILVIFY